MYVYTIQQTEKETAAQFDKAINQYIEDTRLKGDQINNVTFLTAGDRLTAVFMILTEKEINRARFLQQQQ